MRARDNTLWVMRIIHSDPIDTIRSHKRHVMTTSNSGTHVLHNRRTFLQKSYTEISSGWSTIENHDDINFYLSFLLPDLCTR